MSQFLHMSETPIFIVGAPRSGTTVLRLMLDSHHNIAAGPETHFLKDFANGAERYQRCYEAYGYDRAYWAELTRDFVGSTIIGVTSPEQLDDHLAAAEVKLPAEALAACDRLAKEIRYPME